MKNLKNNCKFINLLFLSFVFCAVVLIGMISFNSQDMFFGAACAEENTNNYNLDFDREEIKIDNVILESDKSSDKAGDNVKFSFNVEPYFSIETIKTIEYKIVSGKNYASVNDDGILSIFNDAKAYENISVQVFVNDKPSNVLTIMVEKTEVEEFEIVADKLTIREGEMAQVSVNKIFPYNSSFKTIKYEIIEGQEYAIIDSKTGLIKVNDKIDLPKAKFKVCAFTCENFVKASNIIDFEIYVPVKNMTLTASDTLAKVSSTEGQDIVLNAKTIGVVTDFNPKYVMDPAYNEYAYISGNVLHVKNNLSKEFLIPVWAEQDGAESNILYIQVYIMTEEIQLKENENLKKVSQFLTYNFSAKTFPTYASSQDFNYSLTDENGLEIFYANIDKNGKLTVSDEAPANTRLKLTIANKDLTKTVYLDIEEYNTKIITLLSNDLPDTVYPCDNIEITALLDNQFQTKNHFQIEFESGDENVFENHGNYISIKDLYELEKLGKNKLSFSIRIKSSTNLYSNVHTFTVNLPVASMQNQTLYVNRGETIYVDMLFNSMNFATNKNLKDLTNQVVNGQTIIINKSNIAGQIEVILPTNLEYNTKIKIPVYSEDGDKTCTINLIIKELDVNKIKAVIANKDSSDYAINVENPELWVGRSVQINYIYNEKPISEYGLNFKSKTSLNAEIEYAKDFATLTAEDVAANTMINFSITFEDGNSFKSYTVTKNDIKIFRPASSTDAVYIVDGNGNKTNSIIFNTASINFKAIYKYEDNISPISSTEIYSNNNSANACGDIVTIKPTTPWEGFILNIHYSQTYNGKEYKMGSTQINASLGYDKNYYMDYNAFGHNITVTDVGNDSNELSGGRVSGDYKLVNMDYQNLKNSGFTKIKMTLNLDISENYDGYQEIYVLFDDDADVSNGYIEAWRNGYVEHTPGEGDSSWYTHTFTIEISLDMIMKNPYIVIACGAHGYGNDSWRWGWTRIDFEAIA